MARRSSANAQLVHASAGSAAPLIHASVGPSAQLTHASTGSSSAPNLAGGGGLGRARASADANANKPVAGRNGVAQLEPVGKGKMRSWVLKDAAGNVLKKYSAQEATDVMKRGAVGGTMNALDQQAYFRATGGETEAEKDARVKQEAQDEWNRQQGIKNQAAVDDAARKAAEWDRQQKILQQNRLEQQQLINQGKLDVTNAKDKAKTDAEIAASEAFNERYGIDSGTRLSKVEQSQIATGKMRWGYDPKQEAEIKQMENDAEEGRMNGTLSDEDFGKAMDQINARRGMMRKGLQKNTDERTAEQIFAGATKGPDGRFYYKDNDGNLKALGGDEQAKLDLEKQKIQDQRDYRRQEREDKRIADAEDRREIKIRARAQKLMDLRDEYKDDPVYKSYEEAYAAAMDEADAEDRVKQKRAPISLAVTPAAPAAPVADPTNPVTAKQVDPNNPFAKWMN